MIFCRSIAAATGFADQMARNQNTHYNAIFIPDHPVVQVNMFLSFTTAENHVILLENRCFRVMQFGLEFIQNMLPGCIGNEILEPVSSYYFISGAT